MEGLPRLTFQGDKKKAQKLKGQALNFWQTIKSQPLNQGLNSVTRTKYLADGVVITAQVNKNDYVYSGFVSIFAPFLPEETVTEGFYYSTTSSPLKVLASNQSGFLPPDQITTEKAYGMVDWTNHQNTLITWRGAHRYCPPIAEELKVFNRKNTLNLKRKLQTDNTFTNKLNEINATFDDVKIAGCALKNKVYLIFLSISIQNTSNEQMLYFIFISKEGILAQGQINGLNNYKNYLQTVVISPDCTKASTIAYKSAYETDIISIVITLDIENQIYAVTLDTVTNQSVPFHFDDATPITENVHYTLIQVNYSNIIIAIDYLPDNTVKTFKVAGSFKKEWIEINNLNPVLNGEINTVITTDYNGIITTGFDDQYSYVNDNETYTLKTANAIIINDLDLRHQFFSYTKYEPKGLPLNPPSLLVYEFFEVKLKLKTIDGGYNIIDNNSFDFLNVVIYPQRFPLLNPFWLSVAGNTPLVTDRVWTQDFFNPFDVVRTGISLFDRYENALCFFQPIKTINYIPGELGGSNGVFFEYYFKKTIQIDNQNRIFSNKIVDLKGIS